MDNICRRYNRINRLIKRLEAEKAELRVQLMACDGETSQHYQVKVTESKADRVESLKAIRDKSESLFKALHEAGCIKEVVSTRVTVKEIK